MPHADALADAEESLAILLELEESLLEVGAKGQLTLATTGRWAEDLADCRRRIRAQRAHVDRLRSAQETPHAP